MTVEEARPLIVEGINYAAYKETESSLYDSDKNRFFGSEHYKSGRHIVKRSSWAEGGFEENGNAAAVGEQAKPFRPQLRAGPEPFGRGGFAYRARHSAHQDHEGR
jgi:hypothetical protein